MDAEAMSAVVRGPGHIRRERLRLPVSQAVADVFRGRHAEVLPEDAAEVIGVAVSQHFGDGAHAEGGIAQKLQRVRHFEPGDVSGHRCVQVLPKQAHDVLPRQMKRIAEIGKRQRFGVMLVNVVQHAREHRRITARAGLPAAHI